MLSQMAEKAAFVNYIPRLTQATADDGEPTPAYLLDDIVKITYQSVTASHQLVDYLAHRLSKSSSTLVKIKVLKIILYVISNGHLSFREELQMHDGSIKNVLQHSGPLDPLLGNALYKDTQKLAQEALDLLFNPDMMAKEDSNSTAMENSQVFMAGMGASSPSSGKYEGFGNTPKDREGTVADKMLDYLGRLIHSSDEHTNEAIRAALHSSPGDYQPIVVAEVLTDPVLSSEIPTMKASFVKNHVPGRAGGGWESDEDEDNNVGIVLTESELSSSILSTHQDSPDCFHARSSSQVEDITQNEAQSIILHFKNTPGLPTLEELDKMCAKCATVGFSETFNAVSKINLDLTSYSTEGQLLRILFLYEWFFFYLPDDHDKGLTETLNDLIKDQNLPALCKSKARKVKLLYERSKGIL